jgi:heme/copper-type cytochrome/quinol oxidase subunit 3
MNPIRSLVAVLGGILLISVVVEVLEFTLVSARAGGAITDMAGYFAVRNQPAMLAAKLVYNTLAAVLGGYMIAKIAGSRELLHGALGALLQTGAFGWGFTAGEYAAFTPVWMRIALVALTAPAMLAGAAIRARAARSQT